ncbi:MAG: S8/S53 family peptidase [Paludibacteraceae bacterium]
MYIPKDILNNKPNAYVYADLTKLSSGYSVGVIITASDGSTVHGWADDYYSYFDGNSVSGWVSGDSKYSMGEIGGTGKRIISVGAYTSSSSYTDINNGTYSMGETQNKLASFSSKGPTVDNRIKPEITAPGTVIVSSFSSAVLNSDYGDYFVKKNTVNGVNYYYGAMQGTSMASPFATGVLALWLEAKNDLTPEQVRTVLQTSSIADSYTGTIPSGGNTTWGNGKIDAWAGVKACLALETSVRNIETIPIMLYPNPCVDKISVLFSAHDSNVYASVYSLNGQQVLHQFIGNVNAAQQIVLDVNNLPQGIYLLHFNGNNQYKVSKIVKK